VAAASSGLVRSVGQLAVTRGFAGIGEASYMANSPGLISDLYPTARRGRMLSIFYSAGSPVWWRRSRFPLARTAPGFDGRGSRLTPSTDRYDASAAGSELRLSTPGAGDRDGTGWGRGAKHRHRGAVDELPSPR
jgi:hypothetical protein